MALLKRKNKVGKEDVVFIGANVPNKNASFITLYCNAYGYSKSFILTTIVEDWVKRTRNDKLKKKLISLTAKRIRKAWNSTLNMQKTRRKFKSFQEYCEAQKTELIEKGIDKADVEDIFNKVETSNDINL